MRIRWIRIFCLCVVPLAGGAAEPLRVVATTTMLTDLAREIGGEAVEVTGLMGPGVDPHTYKTTRQDVVSLRRAQVVLYNGLHLEGRMGDALERLAERGKAVVEVGAAVPAQQLLSGESMGKATDPHVWFDPRLWAICAEAVAEAFAEAKPSRADEFRGNLLRVQAELAELDAWAKERLAVLPVERRVLITSHDAYNYFGRAYEFQVIGVQGISTVSEAGLADVARMVDFIREHEVGAIFVESSVSPAAIKRISEDSGARLGGELFSDAMGEPGKMETGPDGVRYDVGTYAGMFRHNVNTIVGGLAEAAVAETQKVEGDAASGS